MSSAASNIIKAELHCHIEGAARPKLVLAQAGKYGEDASRYISPDKQYIWHDFTSFLEAYDFAASLFRRPEDYVLLVEDHYRYLAKQNCIYGEIFASPDHAEQVGFSYNELIASISEGIDRAKAATGIEGRIIVVGIRHKGPEAVEKVARLAAGNKHRLVTGFGMAGEERMFRPADFARAFAIAGDGGLGLTVHAGELCGPQSVREALNHLRVTRIGHGIRAIEDPELVRRIADDGIVLEICPSSNVMLKLCKDYANHPMRALEQSGCIVTLNSDDPPHFRSSLAEEYRLAEAEMGFGANALASFTRNAIEAAFIDEDTRRRLLEKCRAGGLS